MKPRNLGERQSTEANKNGANVRKNRINVKYKSWLHFL